MLSCTSRGSPPDAFTWRKDSNSSTLKQFATIADIHTPTSAVFTTTYLIDRATLDDDGVYKCTVNNLLGTDSKVIGVRVYGKCAATTLH